MIDVTDTAIKAKLLPYKVGAAIVAAILLTVLVMVGIGEFNSMRSAAAKSELQDTKAETTQGILNDASAIQAKTQRVEVVVSNARDSYNRAEQEAIDNEPDTRDWSAQPTRDSLRNAARARRLARERSAELAGQRQAEHEEAPAPER